MRRLWTYGGGLATSLALLIAWLAFGLAQSPASPPASLVLHLPTEAGVFVPRGAGSCAAAACHGSAEPANPAFSRVLRNEHTTWISNDPHSHAYEVLSNPRSQSIARNLGNVKPADKDERCLACHVTATKTVEASDPDLYQALLSDGVSCESCHGPSSGWVAEHTRFDWNQMPKKDYGFHDLSDPSVRAQTCAGCHVGSPAKDGVPLRDVNHDLIAAGHPRLNWEFSANMANYPKHWNLSKESTPGWDATLWKIGQIATMKAATELLEDRANNAKDEKNPNGRPWPEFSEYGCFSCHFSLQDKPFRVLRDPDVPLGAPSWASWNLPMLRVLASSDKEVTSKLKTLHETMSSLNAKPGDAAAQASSVRESLDRWLAEKPSLQLSEIGPLVKILDARDDKGRLSKATSWDSAAQIYLGLAALQASQPDKTLHDELEALLNTLKFPPALDSPRGFNPGR